MNSISVCEEENVESITVELPGVVVHSLYKPLLEPFILPRLGQKIKPHIVIGDFNSHSTLWGYNPDLIFVSSDISDICEKSVLDPITRTQHRPICVTVHPVIVPQPTPFRRRFNLRKAKWDDFSTDSDESTEEVEPIPENYDRFIGLIRVVSRRHTPRGVEQTTYLVSRKSHRAYMKHTRNSTQATRLPKEP